MVLALKFQIKQNSELKLSHQKEKINQKEKEI